MNPNDPVRTLQKLQLFQDVQTRELAVSDGMPVGAVPAGDLPKGAKGQFVKLANPKNTVWAIGEPTAVVRFDGREVFVPQHLLEVTD